MRDRLYSLIEFALKCNLIFSEAVSSPCAALPSADPQCPASKGAHSTFCGEKRRETSTGLRCHHACPRGDLHPLPAAPELPLEHPGPQAGLRPTPWRQSHLLTSGEFTSFENSLCPALLSWAWQVGTEDDVEVVEVGGRLPSPFHAWGALITETGSSSEPPRAPSLDDLSSVDPHGKPQRTGPQGRRGHSGEPDFQGCLPLHIHPGHSQGHLTFLFLNTGPQGGVSRPMGLPGAPCLGIPLG